MVTEFFGILNLTPDSFSDGGKFNQLESALKQTQKMIDEGADIIDIGAESTRPNSTPISHEIEWDRIKNILPEIIKLAHNNNKKISLDSRHYQTIKKALDLGIDIINDVSGFCDPNMINLASKSQKLIILMHNLGVPAKKEVIIDKNLDVIKTIIEWSLSKIELLEKHNIKRENIIFDPGIGFGKDAQQSIYILENIDKFKILKTKILVGHSRKSFLDHIKFDHNFKLNSEEKFVEDIRDIQTLIVSKMLQEKGVDYLRVHNISLHRKSA